MADVRDISWTPPTAETPSIHCLNLLPYYPVAQGSTATRKVVVCRPALAALAALGSNHRVEKGYAQLFVTCVPFANMIKRSQTC
jgi:hypothetical protein